MIKVRLFVLLLLTSLLYGFSMSVPIQTIPNPVSYITTDIKIDRLESSQSHRIDRLKEISERLRAEAVIARSA